MFQSFSCSFYCQFHWKSILLFFSLFCNKNLKICKRKYDCSGFYEENCVLICRSCTGLMYWIQEPACLKIHRCLQFLLQWTLQELCKPRDRSGIIIIMMSESHSIRMDLTNEKLLLLTPISCLLKKRDLQVSNCEPTRIFNLLIKMINRHFQFVLHHY